MGGKEKEKGSYGFRLDVAGNGEGTRIFKEGPGDEEVFAMVQDVTLLPFSFILSCSVAFFIYPLSSRP